MSQSNSDLLIGYSKNERDQKRLNDFEKSTGYVEFIEMVRKRPEAADESIILDIVNMDAEYDSELLPNKGIGKLFAKPDSEVLLEKSRYENFHTIDWLKDLAKDRYRRRWIREKDESGYVIEKLQHWHDAISGWFCVLLVAICTAITAGLIDISFKWMSNLKSGVCKDTFWLDREQCCWDAKDANRDIYQNVNCSKWSNWNEIFQVESPNSDWWVTYIIHISLSLLLAFLAAVLVKFFAPYACGSGVPEIKTILSGYVMNGYLGKWTLLVKSVGMILATSAGLTLGKEGPMVHVACCFGNILSYLFPKYGRNEAKKREILSAAAATGVAVAFGAPIGGVLFSLEELSYYFPMKTLWRSFFCAMTGAFILKTINPFGQRSDVLFYLDYTPDWYFFELIPFVFLGMLGGAFGCYFIKTNIFICKLRKTTKLKNYPVIEVLAVALLSSTIGHFNPYTQISMSDLIKRLVSRCTAENQNALLCNYQYGNATNGPDQEIIGIGPGIYEAMWKLALGVLYYSATLVITFGIKIPCGLFIPSLVIGSLTGRLVGMAMEIFSHAHPSTLLPFGDCDRCIVPGVYALIGACAFLGGATRMTVSMVVIMVELTAGLSLIVPLMVSAFTAKIFGEFLHHGGIYDEHVHLNSYPFLENAVEYKYKASALDVMRPKKGDKPLITLTKSNMKLNEIETLIRTSELNGFPVVVSRASLLLYGYVWTRDLKKALEHYRYLQLVDDFTDVDFTYYEKSVKKHNTINLYNLVDTAPITVSYQIPMEVVIDLFCKMGVSILLVCYYGHILGTITRKDILRHLAEEEKTQKNK